MKLSIAGATLSAFADRSSRRFAIGVYGLFAFIGSIMPLIHIINGASDTAQNRTAAAFVASIFLMLGTGIVWLYYARNSLSLIRSARTLRMPSTVSAVFSGLLLLFGVTVLLPAVILGWYGGNFLLLLSELSGAAFAGLLVTLFNKYISIGLIAVLSVAPAGIKSLCVELKVPLPPFGSPGLVVVVLIGALLLGVTCAARWMWMLRDDRRPSFWIGGEGRQSLIDKNNVSRMSAQHAKTSAKVNLDGVGPQSPVDAMGAWLGPPFSPRSVRQKVLGMCVGLVIMLLLSVLFASSISKFIALPWIGFMALFGVSSSYSTRLRHLFLGHRSDLAELALLPGWGNVKNARHVLLVAVFRPLVTQLLGVCVMIALSGLILGAHGVAYLLIGVLAMGVGSASIAICMRTLTEMKESDVPLAIFLLVTFTMMFTWLVMLHVHKRGLVDARVLWLIVPWLAYFGLTALLTFRAYRRFIARPHPFLQG